MIKKMKTILLLIAGFGLLFVAILLMGVDPKDALRVVGVLVAIYLTLVCFVEIMKGL